MKYLVYTSSILAGSTLVLFSQDWYVELFGAAMAFISLARTMFKEV